MHRSKLRLGARQIVALPITFTPDTPDSRIADSVPCALHVQIEQINVPGNESVILDCAPFPTIVDGVTFDALHTASTDGAPLSLLQA